LTVLHLLNVEEAELVAVGVGSVTTTQGDTVSKLKRAMADDAIIGIVSRVSDITDFNTIGYNIAPEDNPMPVALNGRVLVKVSEENGPIQPGDKLTVSQILPGYAAKMVESGQSIGVALEASDESIDKIMTFVNLGYQKIDVALNEDDNSIVYEKNINMSGMAINNVKTITSISGNWSISEDGTIFAKQLCLEDVCINKDQLKTLLENNGLVGGANTNSPSNTGSVQPTPAPVPPATPGETTPVEETTSEEPVLTSEPDPTESAVPAPVETTVTQEPETIEPIPAASTSEAAPEIPST